MKKSHILTTLAVVAALAVVNVAAAASHEVAPQRAGGNGQLQEVRQAIEDNDYEAWKTLTQTHPNAAKKLENINADNFHLLNEMYQAKQAGNMDKVKEIADQLRIKSGPIARNIKGRMHKRQMRQEVRDAIKNRDYNAWYKAMMPPILQDINEGNFNTFVDMHEAMQAGDTDKAEQLRQELGLPKRPAQGAGAHTKRQGNHAGARRGQK